MIKTVDPRHKLTFDTTEMLVPSLISFGPLIVTVSGWAKAYRARRIEPLHPFAFTLLVVITALAAVPAGSFIYFRLRPVHHLPPWQNPEVAFLGWFFLLGPFCVVFGFLAFRNEPKWLFWVLEVAVILVNWSRLHRCRGVLRWAVCGLNERNRLWLLKNYDYDENGHNSGEGKCLGIREDRL